MSENINFQEEDKVTYAKFFSSLFCTTSLVGLSILCLLNNLSLDLYSMLSLLKVVLPATFCFWFLGKTIGAIFDRFSNKIVENKIIEETKAYEIPSMFAAAPSGDDEIGDIL